MKWEVFETSYLVHAKCEEFDIHIFSNWPYEILIHQKGNFVRADYDMDEEQIDRAIAILKGNPDLFFTIYIML